VAKKKSAQAGATVTENTQGKAVSVRLDPEYVGDRLTDHRRVLLQDVNSLRMGWSAVAAGKWPNRERGSAMDYLRSCTVTFQTSTTAAWHPFILDYCRTLGVDPAPIDRLFQRIVFGDVTDKRVVESDGDEAMTQLDLAIAHARQQWLSGDPVIRTATKGPAVANAAGSGRAEANFKQTKANRGRRKGSAASDVKEDQRIADAWATRQYASLEELATTIDITKPDVVAALDRHRKRQAKPESIRAGKRRQAQ